MHRAAAEQYKTSSEFNNQLQPQLQFKRTAPASLLQTDMLATSKHYIIHRAQL